MENHQVSKKKYVIEPSVDMVVQNIDQLIDFIEAGTPRKEASSNPELEYGFGFLGEHIRNDGLNNSPFRLIRERNRKDC